ncbi:MAG: transcription-repair coupling factor, partial [Caulobacteraceae bacterium]|nr:transcription-repair coupling factor [Caulobacteraceae bacterium]
FRGDHFANPAGLVAFVQKNAAVWRLRPDQKVVVKGEWETPAQRLVAAERILRELANLAKGPAAGPQVFPWAPPAPPPPPPAPPKRVVVKHRPGVSSRPHFRR